MYMLIKCILKDACISKELDIDYFMFTIPTGSSDYSKKIYRNCIKKACSEIFKLQIDDSKIIIIEEYRLLSLCFTTKSNNNSILLSDIGNLTVDNACLERQNENEKFKLTHSSAEVSGTELIHQTIEKYNNINSFNLMSAMFSSCAKSLNEECLFNIIGSDENLIKKLDTDIEKAINNMITPIFEVYMERNIDQVILFGAITDQPYFKSKIEECFKNANDFYSKRVFLKKEFKTILQEENEIKYHIHECKRTALIQGIEQLLKKAILAPITLIHTNQPTFYQERAGILLSASRKKRKKQSTVQSNVINISEWLTIDFNINKSTGDGISSSDFEILIVKFRNTTNLNKLTSITRSNYNKIGLFDIERHSTYSIEFCKEITACGDNFDVKVDLNKIYIRYMEFDNYMEQSFDFNRNICVERVSVNEIPSILTSNESETMVNFYGNPIRAKLTVTLNKGTIVNDSEQDMLFKSM
ncbi:predicted protein [Naegleria gruberi]|uniref:Predicted protein n=1 Tax=Naegleria gruberi TaxID=5762 RepID=D2W4A3_NAEGR|nr:uncharacterized protein NAEGRDRAFT_76233 [Naegleria gruberi]EFC36098.1 predicted protein [Naegleria gruberi]|eukprot:XP_002668842.1 predicted protein [Naegleria gruberi strain NEG-M]